MIAYYVPASSVEDYLARYYRPERVTPTLATTYHSNLAESGYVCTAGHDNVTGRFIFWCPAGKEACERLRGRELQVFGE